MSRAKATHPDESQPVTLDDWRKQYALRRGLCPKASYFMGRSVELFEIWLCRDSTIKDLDEDVVSRWVMWLEERYAPRTIAGVKASLVSIWRYLAEEKKCGWPGRIRKAPKPTPQPIAWTVDELKAVRLAATKARGHLFNGVSRALYLTTLIDVAYESGLRRGDLWRLEQSHFMPTGIIILRQHKTGWPHEPLIYPDTLERVRQLPGKYPLRWPGTDRCFYDCWRIWVLRPSGVRSGVLQQLRRTGATQIESIRPHETSRYLGHKSPEMKAHYVDRAQAYGPAPQPPRFWDAVTDLPAITRFKLPPRVKEKRA